MHTREAIINPVMGRKPPRLGNCCVMAANRPDLDSLHRLLRTPESISHPILMSRLLFGYENPSVGIVGPFIGAPYAVILLESLIEWDVRKVLFLGWCGAVSRDVSTGDVIIPDRAFMDDGTSKNYAEATHSESYPSNSVQSEIKSALTQNNVTFHEGPVWSTDAIFRETKEKVSYFQNKKALAVEMEAAALFAAGKFRNIDVGCILVVSDELSSFTWKPGFKNPVFKSSRTRVCDIIRNSWIDS